VAAQLNNWTKLDGSAGVYARPPLVAQMPKIPAEEQAKLNEIVREVTAKIEALVAKLPR
jgi:hypothetical protein